MPLDPEADEIEVRLVLEAIHARYGYDLREYMPASMRRRVHGALARSGAAHLGELQHRLLEDAGLFASVLDDLMVPVTEMFRDPGFFRAFRNEIVPVLRTYPQLKIWHAGCASGEEVYATAILLSEEGLYDRTQIYATDLSSQALDRAREGVYPLEQAARFAENHRASGGTGPFEAYVTAAYDRIAIRESLRRNVVFFQHNLVSDQSLGEMQVVFCRNVFIYFGADLRRRILSKLADSLCRGGVLCLGMSERLPDDCGRPEGAEGVEEAAAAVFREVVAHQRIYRKA